MTESWSDSDEPVRAYGRYEVVREDGEVLEFSALGPTKHDAVTGFSHHGVLGADLNLDDGRAAAAYCARALLSAATSHLGDLDRIRAVRRVRVFVATAPGFSEHVQVADVVSGALVDALGRRGVHARSVMGVASLPFNLPLIVEMTVSINPAADQSGSETGSS